METILVTTEWYITGNKQNYLKFHSEENVLIFKQFHTRWQRSEHLYDMTFYTFCFACLTLIYQSLWSLFLLERWDIPFFAFDLQMFVSE